MVPRGILEMRDCLTASACNVLQGRKEGSKVRKGDRKGGKESGREAASHFQPTPRALSAECQWGKNPPVPQKDEKS